MTCGTRRLGHTRPTARSGKKPHLEKNTIWTRGSFFPGWAQRTEWLLKERLRTKMNILLQLKAAIPESRQVLGGQSRCQSSGRRTSQRDFHGYLQQKSEKARGSADPFHVERIELVKPNAEQRLDVLEGFLIGKTFDLKQKHTFFFFFLTNGRILGGEAGEQQAVTLEKANAGNMGECFSNGKLFILLCILQLVSLFCFNTEG